MLVSIRKTLASRAVHCVLLLTCFVGIPLSTAFGNQGEVVFSPWHGSWQMFGPIASEKDPGRFRPWFEPRYEPLPLDGAVQVPASLVVDTRKEAPRTFIYEGQEIDFQQLWHTNDGQGIVYMYRSISSDVEAMLPVICRARGWVDWWVNGVRVFAGGDDGEEWTDHELSLPLRPGDNVVCLRLAAGQAGWSLALERATRAIAQSHARAATPIEATRDGKALSWTATGFVESDLSEEGDIRVTAQPFVPGRLLLDDAPEVADRMVHVRLAAVPAAGSPVECFVQIKDGIVVGFTGRHDARTNSYRVVWQMRDHGRSVWEVDHGVAKDWAGVSPLAGFHEARNAREVARMDLDGLGGHFSSDRVQEWVVASRDDEITIRVNGMENLVLRHRIEGSASRAGACGLWLQGVAVEISRFDAGPLPEDIRARWALGDNPPVRWAGPAPDPNLPGAGYPEFTGIEPITIYRAHPSEWTFSHHAKVAHCNGRYYAAWSNSYMHEDSAGTRVRGAVSEDGYHWSPSFVMLPALSAPADEMNNPHLPGIGIWPNELGAFIAIEDRVYVLGRVAYRHGYLGESGLMGMLARRIEGAGKLGPPFWLGSQVRRGGEQYPAYSDAGDPQVRADGAALLERLRLPEDFFSPGRSMEPRDQYRGPRPEAADFSIISHDPIYTCPDGTQVRVWRNYNGTHRIYVSLRSDEDESWGLGIPTNIPDSPSGVAVGELPDGRVYLIGNQVSGALDDPDTRPYRDPRNVWPFRERDFQPEHFPRDPLVLALSADGYVFDQVWALRHSTPDARFNGLGWLPGFQYPDVVVADDRLWVLYSVNKEDVEILPIPLSLLPAPSSQQ